MTDRADESIMRPDSEIEERERAIKFHQDLDASSNSVQPGTFGPVFDAGVEEGKRQARHAIPNRVHGHGEPLAPVLSESESDWRGTGRLDATPNRVQPSIVNLDDGGVQIEWHCRQFDIEIDLSADDELESVYVHDLVSGFKVEKDV